MNSRCISITLMLVLPWQRNAAWPLKIELPKIKHLTLQPISIDEVNKQKPNHIFLCWTSKDQINTAPFSIRGMMIPFNQWSPEYEIKRPIPLIQAGIRALAQGGRSFFKRFGKKLGDIARDEKYENIIVHDLGSKKLYTVVTEKMHENNMYRTIQEALHASKYKPRLPKWLQRSQPQKKVYSSFAHTITASTPRPTKPNISDQQQPLPAPPSSPIALPPQPQIPATPLVPSPTSPETPKILSDQSIALHPTQQSAGPEQTTAPKIPKYNEQVSEIEVKVDNPQSVVSDEQNVPNQDKPEPMQQEPTLINAPSPSAEQSTVEPSTQPTHTEKSTEIGVPPSLMSEPLLFSAPVSTQHVPLPPKNISEFFKDLTKQWSNIQNIIADISKSIPMVSHPSSSQTFTTSKQLMGTRRKEIPLSIIKLATTATTISTTLQNISKNLNQIPLLNSTFSTFNKNLQAALRDIMSIGKDQTHIKKLTDAIQAFNKATTDQKPRNITSITLINVPKARSTAPPTRLGSTGIPLLYPKKIMPTKKR